MLDVAYVALFTAFFGLSLVLVRICDRIIGEEPIAAVDPSETEVDAAEVAA